jgi:hypothetical protein
VHCAARAHLSAGATAWHCGRGPPVSPSAPRLFGRPRDVPRRAARAHCGLAAVGRCRAATLSHATPGAPSPYPVPALHAVTTPGPPSSASPPPPRKAARCCRACLSFSLTRSPPRTAKRPASHPCRRPSQRGPYWRVSDRRHRRPTFLRRPHPRLDQAARPWPSRPSGRPRVAGRRPTHCSHEPVSIVLNSRNYFKLPKFVETCRNVKKLQNKFCWTPLEPLYAVGLTKLTFIQ